MSKILKNQFLEEDIKKLEFVENDQDEEKAEKKNSKVACWFGTWNNPTMTDKEFEKHLQKLYEDEDLAYAVFQREKGEECGTIHFQFFINFKNARYFKTVKELLPYGCHFKPMRTTKTICSNYCQKADTRVSGPYEIGELVEERGRSDLAKITLMLEEGIPLRAISKIYPNQCIMYSRQLKEKEQEIIQQKEENKFRKLEVIYIHGKSGEGKTRYVMEKFGYSNVYRVKFYDGRAFDKYHNQDVILFDEFRSSFKITDMLHYLDGYPLELPCRYYDKTACYTKVYIITNIPLEEQYPKVREEERETWNAFKRRIHKVYDFDNPDDRAELKFGKTQQITFINDKGESITQELELVKDSNIPF